MNTAYHLTDIFPDGDVILVVGPESLRLRVNSQCLGWASKVFQAMFGSDWVEGEGLSKTCPKEVTLIEDDADALRVICCIIHHRNDGVPQTFTPREVLELAIEADKFDISVALRYASIQWLKPNGILDMVDTGYLMAAAFLFGDMERFMALSQELIFYYKGSYMEIMENVVINQIIPWKTIYLLEERRNKMRAELTELLNYHSQEENDSWSIGRVEKYKALHIEYGPVSMIEVPVSEIAQKIKKIETIYYGGWYHQYEFVVGALRAMRMRASICFECLKSVDAVLICQDRHEWNLED